jgi:Sulfotransferase domain
VGKLKDFWKSIERKLLPGHDPDFLIIGTQKSGTTSLYYWLNRHPKLAGSYPKEIQYFSRHQHKGKDLNWYRKRFTSFKREALHFEASPSYIFNESIAKQLKELYPTIKLIVILRNPIDRAYSAWNMYRQHYKRGTLRRSLPARSASQENLMFQNLTERNDYPTFRQAIEIEQDLIAKGEEKGINFLRKGLYYDQIATYLKYFDAGQLLILSMRELDDPQKIVAKILLFLFIDNSGPQVGEAFQSRNARKYQEKINPEDRAFLEEFYRESNQKLFGFLGQPMDW